MALLAEVRETIKNYEHRRVQTLTQDQLRAITSPTISFDDCFAEMHFRGWELVTCYQATDYTGGPIWGVTNFVFRKSNP
jgi:hypothetical protein